MADLKNGKIIEKQGKRKRVATYNSEPTRTQQQYKDQVNINNIMDRYKKTGTIAHIRNAASGTYMDLTEIPDLQGSLMQIKKAELAFLEIPAQVRLKFNNDPSQLITYLKDSKNHDEAIQLGLMVKRDEPNPKPNDATQPPASQASDKK